jgi:ABC-type branched-subunit amino acid transport system substrate-binding protein
LIDRKHFTALLAAPFVLAGTRVSAQTASAQPYKIGVTFPLTGPFAASSAAYTPAIEVAIAHINKTGGVGGHQLVMALEDSQSTPQGGVAAMRKLAQVDGVQAIITIYTNVVTAQIPLADQLKVPFLCPAQAPDLMNKGQFSFAHAETVTSTVALYRDVWRKEKRKKIFAFVPNNAMGPYFGNAVRASASAIGADYLETSFDFGQSDYRGLVARLKDFGADAIFLATQGGTDDTTIIKQVREAAIKTRVDLSANYYNEPAWRAGIGTYIDSVVLAGVTIDPKAGKTFIDDYTAKTGGPPSPVAAEIYDMVTMFAAAIKSGGYDGVAIQKQLSSLKGVPSVLGGTITMEPDHYSPPTNALFVVRNGAVVPFKVS